MQRQPAVLTVLIAVACPATMLLAQQPAAPAAAAPATAPSTQPTVRVIYAPGSFDPGPGGVVRGYPVQYGQMPVPPDAAQFVSVVLQVDSAGGTDEYGRNLGGDTQSATSLLTSTALIDAALSATPLKLSPELRREVVVVNAMPAGYRFTRLDVSLRKHDKVTLPDNAARDVLAALCDRLKGALEESARATRDVQQGRAQELQRQMDDARKRLADVRSRTRTFRDAMSSLPNDYSGSDPQYAMRNVRQQFNQIQSELTRNRARLAALEPSSSPLTAEWEQVVKLREQRLAQLKGESKPDAAEINAASAKLAEAKAQLAALLRAGDAGESGRTTRSSEVPQLKGQIADAEARLKPYADAMAKLEDPKFQEIADQMPELQQQEQRIKNEVNEIQNRMDSFRRTAQYEPKVVVTVLDGEPDKR